MEKIINYGGQVLYPREKAGNVGKWTYKCMKHEIRIFNSDDVMVAVLVNGVQARATRLESGKFWYSYGDVDGLCFTSLSVKSEAVDKTFRTLGYEAVSRGFMDWVYTLKAV